MEERTFMAAFAGFPNPVILSEVVAREASDNAVEGPRVCL